MPGIAVPSFPSNGVSRGSTAILLATLGFPLVGFFAIFTIAGELIWWLPVSAAVVAALVILLFRSSARQERVYRAAVEQFYNDLAAHYNVTFSNQEQLYLYGTHQVLVEEPGGTTLALTLAYSDGQAVLYGSSENNREYSTV